MSCYPEKKRIKIKNIYLSIYNKILLELIIRWKKIRNRLILSIMLGKPLWVGSTLDDIVAGPEVREITIVFSEISGATVEFWRS